LTNFVSSNYYNSGVWANYSKPVIVITLEFFFIKRCVAFSETIIFIIDSILHGVSYFKFIIYTVPLSKVPEVVPNWEGSVGDAIIYALEGSVSIFVAYVISIFCRMPRPALEPQTQWM
jgi:hypothetical protein